MTARLIVLGLLAEEPLHGYQIKERFDDRGMAHYTKLSVGSLYHAIRTLSRDGHIEEQSREKLGGRPERRVYQLTASGREELERLLSATLGGLERTYHGVDTALSMSHHLPHGILLETLERRHEAQAGLVRALEEERESIRSHVGALLEGRGLDTGRIMILTLAMIGHTIAHEQAELGWLEGLIEALRSLEE